MSETRKIIKIGINWQFSAALEWTWWDYKEFKRIVERTERELDGEEKELFLIQYNFYIRDFPEQIIEYLKVRSEK